VNATTSTRYDAIVIGSGLGGCSAAAYLAAAGQRVLLVERYSVLGGSSHVFRRQGKWEFDCGVHFIGDCGPGGQVPTLLHGLGLDDRIEFLPMESSGFNTTVAPGLELKMPFGWENYLANLVEAFPEDARGLRRFIGVMRKVGEAFDRSSTPASKREFASVLRAAGWAAPYVLMPYVSLMVTCGLKPRTIMALAVDAGAQASTPLALSVLPQAIYLDNYIGGGSYYPKGGGQILAAGFAEVVTSHGGAIRTNTGVERILVENGRVTGVRLDGGEVVTAPTVVSGADIIKTYTDLVGFEHLSKATQLRVKSWRMSHPLINGYFGIQHDISDTPNSNYFAIPNWDDAKSLLSLKRMTREVAHGKGHADGTAWARQFAARQPMFLQSSTRRDPSNVHSAPAGHAAIEVQTITPYDPTLWGFAGYDVASGEYRQDKAYREVKKIVIDGMLARIEQVYPGASSKVEWSELGSPASQERFVGNTGGAPFGLEGTATQSGPLRPGTRTSIDGLFLVGTNTAWGPGTEGAMISGVHAAGAILGRNLAAEIKAGGVIADRSRLSSWGAGFDPLNACRGFGTATTGNEAVREPS